MVAMSVALTAACNTVAPDPGHEGVLVMKPLFFGDGGVDPVPVKPAELTYTALTTSAYYVDMRPMQVNVTIDDAMSADNVPLDFSASIRLQVTDSVRVIAAFGEQWFANNVQKEFENRIRTAIKKHSLNAVAGNAAVAAQIDEEVSAEMRAYIEEAGIPVRVIGVTVGRANPPDSIRTQREATAAQQQRLETEKQALRAEEVREEAERQRARADNAYRLGMQLSPEQFVELKRLDAFREACGDGKCTIVMGTGANTLLALK
jgi:GH24 family phage-related lysozyme (muramidase)